MSHSLRRLLGRTSKVRSVWFSISTLCRLWTVLLAASLATALCLMSAKPTVLDVIHQVTGGRPYSDSDAVRWAREW